MDVGYDDPGLLGTEKLRDILDGIDDVDDLKRQYMSGMEKRSATWRRKIREIMEKNGYTQASMATVCRVTKPAVAKWLRGSIPSGRDTFIRIGFAAHYDLEEMNRFLIRYGRCPALYARSLEDSIYIFVLNSMQIPHTYQECEGIVERVKDALVWQEDGGLVAGKETGWLEDAMRHLSTEDELRDFIQENISEYRCAFSKFYDQVIAYIAINNLFYTKSDEAGNLALNVDGIANAQGWSASLRRCVYEIQQRTWFPRRMKVISLGIHLNMTLDEINELLQMAKMETLCPRDPVESAIIFAVVDADVNEIIPKKVSRVDLQSALNSGASRTDYVQDATELCSHVREVLEYLELPDAEVLIKDLLEISEKRSSEKDG